MKEKKSSFIPRIAMGLICVLVVIYTIYHISSFFGEDVITIAAGVSKEVTAVSGSGYVFRDETLLYSSNSGVVNYLAGDGEKVKKGQDVADVYADSFSSRNLMGLIDQRIALLEASVASQGTDMTELRNSVNDTYYTITKRLSSGDVRGLSKHSDSMLTELNKMQSLLAGENANVSQSLASLYSMREGLFAESGKAVRESVDKSGYFYASADGYESAFSTDAALNLDGDALWSLVAEGSASEVENNCYGKLAETATWYFVLPLSADEQVYFTIGNTYLVNTLSGSSSVLPMTLERTLGISGDEKTVLLVFSCDRLPGAGALDRKLSVTVEVDSVSGIYVPKSAVEYLDGQRGVYILKGSVVRFRLIKVKYSGSDYYLVEEKVEDDESEYAYLTSNELIITNGQNMFDGRILD